MRIALITLALAALAFIGSIIYSMAGKSSLLPNSKNTLTTKETDTPVTTEILKYQIKTDAKIDALTKKIEELEGMNRGKSMVTLATSTLSGEQTIITHQSSSTTIPISGKFLARVMPTMDFSLIENNGIFGLHVFDAGTNYSTYSDSKLGTTLIVSTMAYDVFLANCKALGKDVYSVNETKTFPFRSFFLNPPKSDTIVRIVLEIETQAIAIQMPKSKFNTLKNLLLKK